MYRGMLAVAAACLAALTTAAPAAACSRDDKSYFDAFPDASCLLTQTGTEIDAFGGLRLTTDGELTSETWDTDPQFATALESTLATTGTGTAAALELPTTTLPLTRTGGPVLRPAEAVTPDNENVDDPTVIKVGSTYVMYYTGTAEDGDPPVILRATSPDGKVWTRAGSGGTPQVVLQAGADGDFDEHGVFGAEVIYDANDQTAPYRMYYSGIGDVFTQIGYATSTDGEVWTKNADPVVTVGLPGSRDSFAAAHPDVMRDGGLWKMWYEGDDSTKKSIDYATSTDGVTWSKGGVVIAEEDGGGNTEFGVFAPTVWKSGDTFQMLLGGRKEVSQGVLQTKILGATSTDGIAWTITGPEINPGSGFDSSDLNSPDLLQDPADAAAPFKLYYSGRSIDANGVAHTRIGLSQTTNGTGWQGGKFDGAETGDSVLDESAPGTVFDARSVSDLTMADANGSPDVLTGAYVGTKNDNIPRLGLVTSSDGTTMTRLATAGQEADGSVVPVGSNNQFDEDGHRDPWLLYESSGGDDWYLYFTGLNDGARSIGVSSTGETLVTLQPVGPWSNPGAAALFTGGSADAFDDSGVSNPSVLKDGNNSYFMYFTGHNAGATKIGRATATSPTGTFTADATPLSLTGTALCDPNGQRDPVVVKVANNDYRMLYTGLVDSLDGTIERACYATSTNGTDWARAGIALNPSRDPFAFDENDVTPSGFFLDGATLRVYTTGTDRTGRTRAGHASTAFPTPGAPVAAVPSGWATYQYGSAATPPQDFRTLTQTSTGNKVELWMSVLQPYAGDHWSDYFPVLSAAGTANLNFDLRVTAVRIQVREAGASGAPKLDKFVLDHAPVRFGASGIATTKEIAPPDEFTLASWTSMVINSELVTFGTGTGSATATVLDATSQAEVVAATPLSLTGDTTIPLNTVDAAQHPKLAVRFNLTSSHEQATPQINTLKVDYTAAQPGETPTPTPTPTPTATPTPPPPVLTLTATPTKVKFGRSATLSGTLTQGYSLVSGAAVTLTQQPRGASAFAPLAVVTTDANGAYAQVVKPTKKTTYAAAADGAAPPPTVTISVAHRLGLKVRVRGRRATFTGAIGPRHKRRVVTIKRKSGARFVRIARVRTGRRGTYKLVKRFKKGRYVFRATTRADADHLAGRSPKRRARVR